MTRSTYGPAQIYKSMLRFCAGLVAAAPTAVLYESWDSRNDEAELPKVDLFGISGWSYRDDESLLFVSCGLTLSTINDTHLMREIDLLDFLHSRIGTNKTMPIVDTTTGAEVNTMVSKNFQILPTGQSTLRNYRTAAIDLRLTRAM